MSPHALLLNATRAPSSLITRPQQLCGRRTRRNYLSRLYNNNINYRIQTLTRRSRRLRGGRGRKTGKIFFFSSKSRTLDSRDRKFPPGKKKKPRNIKRIAFIICRARIKVCCCCTRRNKFTARITETHYNPYSRVRK